MIDRRRSGGAASTNEAPPARHRDNTPPSPRSAVCRADSFSHRAGRCATQSPTPLEGVEQNRPEISSVRGFGVITEPVRGTDSARIEAFPSLLGAHTLPQRELEHP